MFTIDLLGEIQPLSIYLARANGEILDCIDNYIDESSASLEIGLNEQYELTFDFATEIGDKRTWRDFLQEGMYLFVEKVGLFKIEQPEITINGEKEIKSITAYSCDSELEDKNCIMSLNMGTDNSQEYLVKFDDDELEEVVNPYTGLPYDWLVLYNTFPEQLEIVKEKYNNNYYGTPDSHGDVLVNDPAIVSELDDLLTTIPRLATLTKTDPTTSLSGGIIESFNDGLDGELLNELKVTFDLQHYGAGTPSPDNVMGIIGRTGITVKHSHGGTTDTFDMPWYSQVPYVYSGTLDVLTGILTVDTAYTQITANAFSTLTVGIEEIEQFDGNSFWISNWNSQTMKAPCPGGIKSMCNAFQVIVNNSDITDQNKIYFSAGEISTVQDFISTVRNLENGGDGLYLAYELATPLTYQLTPNEITVSSGTNTFWADGYAGTISLKYTNDPIIVCKDAMHTVQGRIAANNGDKITTNEGDYIVVQTEQVQSYVIKNTFLRRIDDLITFYTKYRDRVSLLPLALQTTGGVWTVGDIYGVKQGNFTLANKKCQFEADTNIYSFLTQDLAKSIECVVNFDILNRKVNVTPVDKIGADTGISFSYENLLNELGISCDEDRLSTRLYVTGANDLDISRVNFGSQYIDDITYKLNAKDENKKRIYVSDSLASKYNGYLNFREIKRERYIELSKEYENIAKEIDEIQYRVPNDNLKNDWGTFTQEELQASLTSFTNLLTALETMYKFDYGAAGLNEDGSINEDFIKTTFYWHDYTAYKNIIDEINCALDVFPYYSDQSKWTSTQIEEYKAKIIAWETEWSLYGIKELQSKIKSYKQNMDLLAESSVIRVSSDSDQIKTWSQLSNEEKGKFGYLESNYYYDTYMEYYNNKLSAETYLTGLQTQLDEKSLRQREVQDERNEIVEDVSIENYFDEDEKKVIYLFYRDADYNNENVVTTTIDSVDEKIDKMVELLNDGKERVSILSRPQLTFKTDVDNLLALKEFEPFWTSFIPGNYMYIQYKDDTYVKLRMLSYEFNPMVPTTDSFSITFSNFIRSNVKISDLESVLGTASSGSGRHSSSSRGGSDYGKSDDIDITISNTMLARLLSSESFGSSVINIVTNTVNSGSITAQSASNQSVSTVRQIAENAVQDVTILFAKSNSQTVAPTTGWSTDAPIIVSGEYVWQKTITTYGTGETESDVVCMTGKDGTDGTDGSSPVILQLTTPYGNVIYNNTGSVSIVGRLMDGSEDKTSSVTAWSWAIYNGSGYSTISGETANTLVVNAGDISGCASYRCVAMYNSNSYTQYESITDKTDPVQVEIMSSLGEQIVNGQGVGVLYAIVTKNGIEVDALKTQVFSTTAPTNPSVGDYYYLLNPVAKTVTLKKYNGSSWEDAPSSDLPTGAYSWTYRDKDGNIVSPTGMATTGKVVYIDATFVNKKLTVMVSATI